MPTAEKGARYDASEFRPCELKRSDGRRLSVGVRAERRTRSRVGSGAANYSNRRIASSQYQNKNQTLIRDNVRRDLGLERPKKGNRTDPDGRPDQPRSSGHIHI